MELLEQDISEGGRGTKTAVLNYAMRAQLENKINAASWRNPACVHFCRAVGGQDAMDSIGKGIRLLLSASPLLLQLPSFLIISCRKASYRPPSIWFGRQVSSFIKVLVMVPIFHVTGARACWEFFFWLGSCSHFSGHIQMALICGIRCTVWATTFQSANGQVLHSSLGCTAKAILYLGWGNGCTNFLL